MGKSLLFKLGLCLGILSLALYSYLSQQNEVTHMKIRLPQMEKQIQLIREENCRLQYEIDRAENPARLIELAHRPEFSNLKHPLMKEILTMKEGIALRAESSDRISNQN